MQVSNGDVLVVINVLGWVAHFVSTHLRTKKTSQDAINAIENVAKNASPEIATIANDVIEGIKHLVQIPEVAVKVAPLKIAEHKLESELTNSKLLGAAAIAFHGLQKRLDELTDADKLAFVEYVRAMLPGITVTNDQIVGAINEVQKMADEAAKNPLFERAAALTDVIQKFRGINTSQADSNTSETVSDASNVNPVQVS